MIWNGKRYKGIQIYKVKGEDDFILVDHNTSAPGFGPEYLGELLTHPYPDKVTPAHGSTDHTFLSQNCYPVSQRRLREFKDSEKWIEMFQKHWFDWEEKGGVEG